MKSRLHVIGAVVLLAAGVAACGGGGGGGGVGPAPPSTSPSHAPTASPTPTLNPFGCVGSTPSAASAERRRMSNPPHPVASGDTFAYVGSLTQTFTQSAPCPQPTSTSAATVAVTVTNSATSPPSGATDMRSIESDAYATHTQTLTTDQTVAQTATAFEMYATSSSDGFGDAIKTVYASPQALDMLGSPPTWSNQPASTVTETLADGTSITRTVKNDGSYTDTETFPGGATAKIAIDGAANGKPLDGGGSYVIGGTTFTYAPPSGGSITLTISGGSTNKTRTFPAWFTVPSSYINDTFHDNGTQPFDPNCHVAGAIGTSGRQVVETYHVLDPVLGYIETRTVTSYVVNGFGAACVAINDELDGYYDYQNDTTKIDYQSQNGQPNSVDRIVEYLGMTAPVSPFPAVRTQSLRAVTTAAVVRATAAVEDIRLMQHASMIRALNDYARRIAAKGANR